MKYLTTLLLFAMLSLSAFGQELPVENPPLGGSVSTFLLLLIPILVPLIVAVGKFFVPRLPSWSLPIIAPALGALIDLLLSLSANGTASPIAAAILGSAGVGIRELIDQIKQRLLKPGALVSLLLISVLPIGLSGCAGGPVQIKAGHDPVVVVAEWTAENALNSIDQFLAWERSNEVLIKKDKPAVHEAAEALRRSAMPEIQTFRNATKQYKATRTDDARQRLESATQALLIVANSVRAHMGLPPLVPPVYTPSATDLMTGAPTNTPAVNP